MSWCCEGVPGQGEAGGGPLGLGGRGPETPSPPMLQGTVAKERKKLITVLTSSAEKKLEQIC